MRKCLLFSVSCLCLVVCGLPRLRAQQVSANVIPASDRMQPTELLALLHSKNAPLVLQVGSHLFFAEAHIAGSRYAGAGSQEQGLKALEHAVSNLPKDAPIVLYCGCCPWDHCPNVGPAWKRLHDAGYTNVKVLYLPHNFGDDWVSKGYPTERE
jgi:rhodanese-related sulfurtransferase